MSAVQNYETDVLQEHVDSTPILIARLDQWRHGVHVVSSYASGYLNVHQSITHNLEKTYKGVQEVPTFTGAPETGESASETQLANVFKGLQQNVNVSSQRSAATANGIKASVSPPLESVMTEIDKHYKTSKQQGTKGFKEVERSRVDTQKAVEHLGQVTSSYGARASSVHDDPYISRRRVERAVDEQLGHENTQAEAASSVQHSFAALETHVITTIRQTLSALATSNEGFDKSEYDVNAAITDSFNGINMDLEWKTFTTANRDQLVPETNYQRDPKYVTFNNKNHASTQPIIQGSSNRKGTVSKSYNQSFYASSPAGYLYQFKNADESSRGVSPDLASYSPECQISRSSTDFVFKIVGKDATKAISTRHKFVFRTNSARELDMWFNAISRVTGNTTLDDDSGNDDTPAQSPVEPPTSQLGNASSNEPVQPVQRDATQQPPSATAFPSAQPGQTAQAVPAQTVPTQTQTVPAHTASQPITPVTSRPQSQVQSPASTAHQAQIPAQVPTQAPNPVPTRVESQAASPHVPQAATETPSQAAPAGEAGVGGSRFTEHSPTNASSGSDPFRGF